MDANVKVLSHPVKVSKEAKKWVVSYRWSIVTNLYLPPFLRYDELQPHRQKSVVFTDPILVRPKFDKVAFEFSDVVRIPIRGRGRVALSILEITFQLSQCM